MTEAPVRVLLVVPSLAVGGAERQVSLLARALQSNGRYRPEVAVFYPDGPLEAGVRESGVPIHKLRRTSKVGWEAIVDLVKLIRRERYTVVHSYLWAANWRARLAAVIARAPVVISSPRTVETWLRWPHVLIDRALARATDAIVVNTGAIRDFLVVRESLPPSLFHVVANGIDATAFAALPDRAEARRRFGIPESSPVVLHVANLEPEKNHDDLLKIAHRVRGKHSSVRFILVGDGECRNALSDSVRALGLDAHVRFEGRQADVRPYLAAADVVVNTSFREGCSNALMEGMAASRPAVAYAVGGNVELIEDGRTGRLIPFGDVPRFADALIDYLTAPELARAHGVAAASRIGVEYSISAMVAKIERLYDDLQARG